MTKNDTKDRRYGFLPATFSIFSICGSFVYYVYSLNWLGSIITLLSGIIIITILVKLGVLKPAFSLPKTEKTKKIAILLYLVAVTVSFVLLFLSRTEKAIVSPWQVTPLAFFTSYAMATTILFFLSSKKFFSILISIHYFLTFSVFWIIFRYGYGYDPLIHQSSLEAIKKLGSIEPKRLLYLGQYSLEILLNRFFFIPIDITDKLLLPLLSAVMLPSAINTVLEKHNATNKLPMLLLLLLPFSIFTLTVPQSLAYLFLLLSILYGVSQEKLHLPWLLSVASFCVHPLAGIPALFWVGMLTIRKILPAKIKNASYLLMLLLLPTAIYLSLSFSQGQSTTENKTVSTIKKIDLLSGFSKQENIVLNFVNFFNDYQGFFLGAIFVLAIAFALMKNVGEKLKLSSAITLSMLLSWFLVKNFIAFSSLISYEQSDYLLRLLIIAFLFTIPVITVALSIIVEKIEQQGVFIKTSISLFSILLLVTSLYCSYPRKDNYLNSKSFSVGKSDFEAVKWVEKDANDKPYVALANQQVSVSALKTLGFDRYFTTDKGEVYFYPIPTGGPLYKIYLDMVYEKADKEKALEAAKLADVETVYFIINKYWWAFDKIIEEAKINTETIKNIDDEIMIFKYSKN